MLHSPYDKGTVVLMSYVYANSVVLKPVRGKMTRHYDIVLWHFSVSTSVNCDTFCAGHDVTLNPHL